MIFISSFILELKSIALRTKLVRLILLAWCSLILQPALASDLASQAHLFQQAESFIISQPQESVMSVSEVVANYRKLELRWVGQDNSSYNHHQIESNPIFAKTELFNSNAKIESNAKISYKRLNYQTNSPDGVQNVSGLLLLPPANAKGIILFFHSTISGKLNVPSLHFQDYKAEMLAGIFAANGYIVVAPDYIGLGDNYSAMHPYIVYPRPNVDDGQSMLLATMRYLKQHQLVSPNKTPLPLFVSGYSEGASYALWFSRIYQTESNFRQALLKQHLVLKQTVAIEGADDLSGVMLPFLLSNQVSESVNHYNINSSFWGSMLKPSLLVNALLSYAYYNHVAVSNLFNPNFYALKCVLGLPICGHAANNQFNIDSVRFSNTNQFKLALNYFFAALFKSSAGISYSPLDNSVQALMNPAMTTDKSLLKVVSQADILNWKSTNPITLVSLAKDSLVPENNSAAAYAGMTKAGSKNVKYIKVENNLLHARAILGPNVADHVSFELYALLIALNEFNHK